ncbi:unnamed protein product [Bursaphelenchus okinawaensis]|uniref:Arrestin_C domain-containing protein n=1 Tax=Bursaphelenchus okinawaensis TaxID=465554 RepID=A0A811KJJ7_9BILA|nr:unnamed protein product [Bursaphelenchus okinawaensis]CAG9105044.1 unnamed protein product [Bursaphelenchus okinawaensis]
MRVQEILSAFSIIYDNDCCVFESADTIRGHVLIRSRREINVSRLELAIRGDVQLKNPKSGCVLSLQRHVNITDTLKLGRYIKNDASEKLKFNLILPSDLYPSVDCKSTTIIYYVQARVYFSYDTEEYTSSIARGFTIIEKVSLDTLSSHYFTHKSWHFDRSYGICPCTRGRITVDLTYERLAFLPGEHIVIKGSIKNNTGRRVDYLKVLLEKIVTIKKVFDKCEEEVSEEVILTRDEPLAMFVEPGVQLVISKNFPLPSMRPSNPNGISIPPYKVYISYRLNAVVRHNGQQYMGTSIPIVIGTELRSTTHRVQRECSAKKLIYYSDKTEGNVPIGEDSPHCFVSAKNLKFMNLYPYFVNLETSSKQSRRIHKLATAIRAENNFLAKLRSAKDSKEGESSAATSP